MQQCGKVARCVALLMAEELGSHGQEIVLQGSAGRLRAIVCDDDQVSLNTGVPNFFPPSLPFDTTSEAPVYTIRLDGEEIYLTAGCFLACTPGIDLKTRFGGFRRGTGLR